MKTYGKLEKEQIQIAYNFLHNQRGYKQKFIEGEVWQVFPAEAQTPEEIWVTKPNGVLIFAMIPQANEKQV